MRFFNQTIFSLTATVLCLSPMAMKAQLSSNPDKFLGNITTSYQVDYGKEKYYTLWNQITCENESKWGSVEGTRNSYNWGCDNAFNYAKSHKFTYKFHALVWGSQYPNWLPNLVPAERFAAMVKWYDAVKKKYNTLPMIDVVNEAVGTHQAGNPMIKETLGGGGKTGYDWLIKAFEMAYERWPDAILIYNDFNTFQWNTDEYIDLVRTLRDAGAPIDAYGCQSHDLTDCSFSNFKSSESKIQTALKMPFYSTEYDIGTENDDLQLQRYKEQIPYMWEKDYCAGITLWGYIYGHTWTTNGNSGLIKEETVNGKKVYTDRPAMTWLRDYMKSDAAKNAKSPFPGMKKEASIYIRPADLNVAKGDKLPIKVRASLATKTIEKVELYVGTTPTLVATMTEEPYIAEYTTSATGWQTVKAVVTATDGSTYERYGRFNVLSSTTKREPYNGEPFSLPGTIDATQYDKGASKVTYYSASRSVAATKDNQWMEYTVDVKEKGIYSFDAEVAAAKAGGRFHLSEYGFDNLAFLTDFTDVPATGSTKDYKILHGVLKDTLTAGLHKICLNIEKGGFYIKSLTLNRYEEDKTMTVTLSTLKPATISVGDTTTISLSTVKTATNSGKTIAKVDFYANNLLIGTLTEAPYTIGFAPTVSGSYIITAIATDSEGKVKTSAKKTLKVNGKRTPYSGTPVGLPGIIQAENFDKGGEGMTFHDSDTKDEGDAAYRTDNEGLDLVKGNSGTAIGYTAGNEWTEYTVNVKEPGEYSFEATCSNGSSSNGGFTINTVKGTTITQVGKVTVTPTGGWGTYKVMTGKLTKNLAEGEQILRFTISGANCNIDKVKFICTLNTDIQTVVTAQPERHVTYNLKGQKVDDNYKGIVIRNGRKILKR
jgi:GH35 family endo-1,4-beta-xylanase